MPRPNLLFFIPDQLRYDAIGCSGNPSASTPNVDALAARGTRFEQCYAQHSVCSPSRVSFLTGWYPHVRGHRSLESLIQADEPNLLRGLEEAGYHVAHAGLRGDTFARGVTRACTTRFGFAVRPKHVFMKSPYDAAHPFARAFYHGKRPGAAFTLDFDEATIRTAERWIDEGLPEPFALYVPLIFPHPPFEVEEPWFSQHARADMPAPRPAPAEGAPRYMHALRARYGTDRLREEDWREIRATYAGMVSRVDAQLGRLLAGLERTGQRDRTATFFFTDHGEYLGDYGLVEKWPAGQHECLLRNPLVVDVPAAAAGAVARGLVELVDLLPTVFELAEIDAKHTHFGKSLVPVLGDAAAPHRDLAFSEGGFSLHERHLLENAAFPYDLKSAVQREDPVSVGRVMTIRTPGYTYVRRRYEGDELYDRAADPGELTNLAGRAELAAVELGLRERLLDRLMETADVMPWEGDPRFDAEGAIEAADD